jgi:hypothetical protein
MTNLAGNSSPTKHDIGKILDEVDEDKPQNPSATKHKSARSSIL